MHPVPLAWVVVAFFIGGVVVVIMSLVAASKVARAEAKATKWRRYALADARHELRSAGRREELAAVLADAPGAVPVESAFVDVCLLLAVATAVPEWRPCGKANCGQCVPKMSKCHKCLMDQFLRGGPCPPLSEASVPRSDAATGDTHEAYMEEIAAAKEEG